MKDIDFDELDRAVSSVLGQKVPASSDDKNSEEVKVASTKTDDTAGQVTLDSPVVSLSPTVISEKPTSSVRRGRFMDVVRPATGSNKSSVDRLTPRTAPSIQPIGDITAPALTPTQSKPNVVNKDEADSSFNVSVTNKTTSAASDMDSAHLLEAETDDTGGFTPTDAELSEKKDDQPNEVVDDRPIVYGGAPALDADLDNVIDATESEAVPEENNDDKLEPVTTTLADTVPQTTPFLSDTKVEKRPLGGFSENDSELTPNDPIEEPDTQVPPTVPMPRELQADIVEVESPTHETSNSNSDLPFATSIAAAAEPQDDGRVEGHPIFDTSTYHEPIIAVHDSSFPGWLKWLIGLAFCLVLGAGVGYFLFTAGL